MTTSPAASNGPAGTFAPRPTRASLPSMIVTHGVLEARLLLRNGEQLLLALVIPLLVLIAGSLTAVIDIGPGRRVDVLTPGVLALAILSTAFTSLAIATGFERRYNVLKRLGASPLPRSGLLAGKGLAIGLIEILQLVVVATVGLLLGWRPHFSATGVVLAIAVVVLATLAFSSLGMLLAGVLRAEATLAAANLVYVLLLIGGAVVLPASQYPGAMAAVVHWLPSGALAEGLRTLAAGDPPPWTALGVLLAWAVAGMVAATRTFRWE